MFKAVDKQIAVQSRGEGLRRRERKGGEGRAEEGKARKGRVGQGRVQGWSYLQKTYH